MWTNSHLNTAAEVVNFITFLGWKLIKICENHDTTSCINLPETMIIYLNTALQPSDVSKPSSKSIGGLIGEA